MKRFSSEAPKLGVVAKSIVALGALSTALAGCSAKNSVDINRVKDFSVTGFTYDQAADLGRIVATEQFETPVTRGIAETSMEDLLNASRFEFQQFFPSIPLRVRSGSIECQVTDFDENQKIFYLSCDVKPAQLPSSTA